MSATVPKLQVVFSGSYGEFRVRFWQRSRKWSAEENDPLQLAALEFPPKRLFGNLDERVASERRTHLERYLRNFFRLMLDSATSPLHEEKRGLQLSKHAVCEFSPFFRKGVFDYSSHGTG